MNLVPPTVPEKPGPTTSTPTTARVITGDEVLKQFLTQKPIEAKIAEITSRGLLRLTLPNGNLIAQINGNVPSFMKTNNNVNFQITDNRKNIKLLAPDFRQTRASTEFNSGNTASLPIIRLGIKITAEVIPNSLRESSQSLLRGTKSKNLNSIGILTSQKPNHKNMRQSISAPNQHQKKRKAADPEFLNLFATKNKLKPNKMVTSTNQKLLEKFQPFRTSNRPKAEVSSRPTITQKIVPNFFRMTDGKTILTGARGQKTSSPSKILYTYRQTEHSIGAKRGFGKLNPNNIKVQPEGSMINRKNIAIASNSSSDISLTARQAAKLPEIKNTKTIPSGPNTIDGLKKANYRNYNNVPRSKNDVLSNHNHITPTDKEIPRTAIKTSRPFSNDKQYSKNSTDIRVLSVFNANKIIKTPAKLNSKANATGMLIAQTPTGQSVIETTENIFILNGTLNYPRGTRVALEVPKALLSPSLRGAIQLPAPFTLNSTFTWPSLENIFERLKGSNDASILNDFTKNRLSGPGKKLTAAMALFLSAVRTGEAKTWLGHNEKPSNFPVRDTILQTLQDDFSVMQRASELSDNGWRAFFIPTLDESQIALIQFFIRQQNEKSHKAVKSSQKNSTQFVVELTLNVIGNMQIDGRVGDKNVELIIRTRKPLQEPLRKGIERVFFSTLKNSDFTGKLSFKVQVKLPPLPFENLNGYIEKSISSTFI